MNYVYAIVMNDEVVYVNTSADTQFNQVKRRFLKRFEEELVKFKLDGYVPEFRVLKSFTLSGNTRENKVILRQLKDEFISTYKPIFNNPSNILPEKKEKITKRYEAVSERMKALYQKRRDTNDVTDTTDAIDVTEFEDDEKNE